MGFRIGNFWIDEVLEIVGQDQNDNMLYSLDQTTSASIEIDAESTDITDKNGNVVRTRYTSKTGTISITEAFMHPAAMNQASGSEILEASASNKVVMPKIVVVDAGTSVDISTAKTGTVKVIGIFGNGANKVMTQAEITAATSNGAFVAPAVPTSGDTSDSPVQYLIKFDRDVESGIRLVNDATSFPQAHKQTWFCACGDPCDDNYKPCYVVLPHVVCDPSATLNFSREDQEFDFNGTLNIDYCGAGTRTLYYIYFPDENLVRSGTSVQ